MPSFSTIKLLSDVHFKISHPLSFNQNQNLQFDIIPDVEGYSPMFLIKDVSLNKWTESDIIIQEGTYFGSLQLSGLSDIRLLAHRGKCSIIANTHHDHINTDRGTEQSCQHMV